VGFAAVAFAVAAGFAAEEEADSAEAVTAGAASPDEGAGSLSAGEEAEGEADSVAVEEGEADLAEDADIERDDGAVLLTLIIVADCEYVMAVYPLCECHDIQSPSSLHIHCFFVPPTI